ncbi:MAG: AmmeMemoRadiSam system protein A [Candidatus Omnitrophica bacterium]|nr:AmmeMemoRadiSam system protein A [Candidatus Omnitrophota bacterium]
MKDLLNPSQRSYLLSLVRDTIQHYLRTKEPLEPKTEDSLLKDVRGAFVTLHQGGRLRGCIGSIVATKPLYLEIRDMAIAASTQDSRFSPVSEGELADIRIEISVLSPFKKIVNSDEIIVGKHGVLVKQGYKSGVYLPQVAKETGWGKEEFMNSLCRDKAGISVDSWKRGECEIYIFSAEVFGE